MPQLLFSEYTSISGIQEISLFDGSSSRACLALDGHIGIYDAPAVTQCEGKYYTFGTGGEIPVLIDGWNWNLRGSLTLADTKSCEKCGLTFSPG